MKSEIRCDRCGKGFEAEVVEGRFGGACPHCVAGFALGAETDLSLSPGTGAPPEPEKLPLQPGAIFRGLEVLEVLGRGGMGVVYQARQVGLDRVVALKVISPQYAQDIEFVRRFNREAKALAALDHPNIVRVIDFGKDGEICFLVMEYVDGISLREVLRDRKLSPAQALGLIPQICEALEYAHGEGVIHRDIKPENILLDKKGRVKIADFGLAKMAARVESGTVTRTNLTMGTPPYMAPEQYTNLKEVDHRADIYALGVILYEMLTGEVPVGRFELPSRRVQVDVKIDDVVLRALENKPEKRYQRASEMGTDVRNVTAGPGAGAGAPGLRKLVQEQKWKEAGQTFWSRLTPRDKEKIGRFVIINTAFFLFFVIAIDAPVAFWCIFIFWGMGLSLDLWKRYVGADVRPSGSPSPRPEMEQPQRVVPISDGVAVVSAATVPSEKPQRRVSKLAVTALVFCCIMALGASIELFAPAPGDRLGIGAVMFFTVLTIVFSISALGMIREMRGELLGKGIAWITLLLAVVVGIVAFLTMVG